MIGLIQRVHRAKVVVDEVVVGQIDRGLLVYLGVERLDDEQKAKRLSERIVGYRIFADAEDKMNWDIRQCHGQLLVVSQFTLAADTKKGRRPSFSCAAQPEQAELLYQFFIQSLQDQGLTVASGQFGADMQVHSINDGPVTFHLTV